MSEPPAPEPSEPALEYGVGPWPGGQEAWPDDPRYDPELLANGDARNVVDPYRYWSMDAIVADLDERRHPFHVAIENWQHDLNIGSIVRSANAFLAAEVHIIGRRRWNRRGAMVTDRYQHVRHHEDVAAFAAWADAASLPILAIDNVRRVGAGRPCRGAGALRAAVRAGGAGAVAGGAGRGIRSRRDHAVRLDALDERERRGRCRDVRVVPSLGVSPVKPVSARGSLACGCCG